MALLSIRTTLWNAQRGRGQSRPQWVGCWFQWRKQLDVPIVAEKEVMGLLSPVAVRGKPGIGATVPQTGLLGLYLMLNIAQ